MLKKRETSGGYNEEKSWIIINGNGVNADDGYGMRGKDKEVSLGMTESGTYKNDYFGVSLNFPKEWVFQSADEMVETMEAGLEIVAGDNADKKKKLDLAKTKTLNLLMASKFSLDSGEIGPSIVSVAEKLSMLQGIKDGKDYLEAYIKQAKASQLPYEFAEITTVKVGGKDMDMLKGTIDNGDLGVVTQEYYSTLIEGYSFNFILTYVDDASKAETDKILESVSFK